MFETLRSNKPQRNLAVLAAATLIAVIAAAIAVVTDEGSVRATFVPHPLFEGLDERLDQVDRIVYTVSRGMNGVSKIELARNGEGRWVTPARGGYPVNDALVKKTLLGVGGMEAYEPRTANPEWHRNLGLLKPEDIGSAVRVEFFKGDERVAGLLVGKVPERAVDVKGEGLIYVRRDGEDETFLARGRLPLYKTVNDWLDPAFIDISREKLARVTLWAGTETPVVLSRAPGEENFSIENPPEGRASRGAPVLNKTATAILDSGFDDVAPAATLDFPEDTPKVIFETFDGLRLHMRMAGEGGALWAKFDAEADPALGPEGGDIAPAEERAREFNERLVGWTYKLPQELGNQLTQTMDLLTREAGPADAMMSPMPERAQP